MTVRNISNLAPQPPPRFTATPASLLNSAKESIIRTQEIQDQLVHKISCTGETASFATFLLPLAQNENVMTWEANLIKFYQYVSPNAELRTASREAKRLLADFTIETSMREDLFKLVKAAKEHASSDDMDIESQRLLRSEYRRYIANGLGLPPGPQRDRFKKISKRMSEVKIEFQKNLDEEDGGVWFTLQELAGVPSDVVERLEHDGEDERKVKVTYQYSDYFPVMDHAKNGETRKKLFLGFENKCQDNVPLFKEMIVLRDERARLLGYLNHAAYQLEDKMVSSTDTVNTFLEDLRLKLVGRGHEEIERLKKLKRANVGDGQYDGHYYLWDQRYYHRAMLEKEYMVDQQQIAEYFGLETTVERMMGIFSILFGLVFSEVSGGEKKQDCTWHPDVKLYHVWDDENQGGEFVGYLYLDLYSRHGKFGHPANFNIRPGFVDANGRRSYPSTALLCSFFKPSESKPCLLQHSEVLTLFHELGHAIHDLVAKTQYSRFHGTRTVQDFCETPSKMLENWCWLQGPLQSLSRHYVTGETIPEDMVESLVKVKKVNNGLFYLRQLHVSIFDMKIHQPECHDEIKSASMSAIYNALWQNITSLEGPRSSHGQPCEDWGHGPATFFHLLSDYGAGYYGYLLAEVYAQDMFYTLFKVDPLNPDEGRRYRRMILEKGGSQPEMQILMEFLGREPSAQAFYGELGI